MNKTTVSLITDKLIQAGTEYTQDFDLRQFSAGLLLVSVKNVSDPTAQLSVSIFHKDPVSGQPTLPPGASIVNQPLAEVAGFGFNVNFPAMTGQLYSVTFSVTAGTAMIGATLIGQS